MAFSLGAVAGGVGETLDRLLAERRAEALARQQAEAQQAERAYRDRQLAQQLQIEQMRDARARAEANATAAGKQLAAIRTRYTNTGKQLEQRFGPGALVPRDVAEPVMSAYDVLTEAGDMPLAPPLTESAIPVQRFVTPMTTGAIAPTPTPGEAVAGGTAMAPMPQPAQAKLPTVPLTRVSAGVMAEPMFTRTPTAEETELQEARAIIDPIDMSAPIPERLQQIGAAQQRVVGLRPRVASTVRETLNALEATTRAEAAQAASEAAARDAKARDARLLEPTIAANEMVSRLPPEEQAVVRFVTVATGTPKNRIDDMKFTLASAGGTPQFGDQAASLLLNTNKRLAENIRGREDLLNQYDMLLEVIKNTPEGGQNLLVGTLGNMARKLGMSGPSNVFDQLTALITNYYVLQQSGKATTQKEYQRLRSVMPSLTNVKDLNLDKIDQIIKIAVDSNNADWANLSGGAKNAETIGRIRTYVPSRAMSGTVTNVRPPQKSGTGANVQSSQTR